MEHSIFKIQTEKADEIKNILDKYRGTAPWETSRKAFHDIIKNYVHGGLKNMSDEDLDKHFELALVTTHDDINGFKNLSTSALKSEKDESSPYYMVNVSHHRHDKYFAPNQSCPITGAGSKKLDAKFDAHNLYQKYPINATSIMPERVSKSPFPTWDIIVKAMTDRNNFNETFDLTNVDQANEVFAATSAIDWKSAEGSLFMTPTLFGGAIFSPALYSVYFFGAGQNSPMNIFFFVTADGEGNPEKPFIGLVNKITEPKKNIYSSVNRFAFSYISDAENPAKYWLNMNEENLLDFNLGIQTFFKSHTDIPYIFVDANFSAQVSAEKVAFFKDIPGLSTILLMQKGTLMRDLIRAYFPDENSAEVWTDIGVLTGGNNLKNDLLAIGLNSMSAIFGADVWKEKPVVS